MFVTARLFPFQGMFNIVVGLSIVRVSRIFYFHVYDIVLILFNLSISGGIVNGGGAEHVVEIPGEAGDKAQVKHTT